MFTCQNFEKYLRLQDGDELSFLQELVDDRIGNTMSLQEFQQHIGGGGGGPHQGKQTNV